MKIPDFEPRPYQLDFLKAMDSGKKRAVLVWHRRCLSEDTHIIMADGSWKEIKDIVIGDQILSHDGEKVVIDTVKDHWCVGEKKVQNYKSKGCIGVECTADHKFAWVYESNKQKIHWDPISKLKQNNLTLSYSGCKNGENNNPYLAEFIGLMISDGYCSGYQQPKFTNGNEEILKRFEFLVSELFPEMETIRREKGNAFDIAIRAKENRVAGSNKVKILFKDYGINTSKEKRRVPKFIWSMNEECIGRFLAGYISGDGNIHKFKSKRVIQGKIVKPGHEIKISCGLSKDLAWDIYWLLRKIGVICREPICDSRHKNWQIRIWTRQFVKKVLNYGPIYGKTEAQNTAIDTIEKTKKRRLFKHLYRSSIKRKSSSTLKTCYDLETEKNHNYFANGYLVHNSGKDLTCFNYMVRQAYWHRVGTYVYFFPTTRLGRRILWDGINKDGKRFISYCPKEIIEKINEQEMKIILKNGSIIQIIGTDLIENVGINPVGVVFSEYSLQNPDAWTYTRPILAENRGWAVFQMTPRGRNHAYDLYLMAKSNPEWYCSKLSIKDTGVLKEDDMDRERQEGMSEQMIQQEFYCSFDQGAEGAYYARLLNEAEICGRLGNVPFDPQHRVSTFWDIGVGDETAIIFMQQIGQEIHIIDIYHTEGEGLSHYASVIDKKAKEHGYLYDEHWAPHDIQVRELGSGAQTRLEIARNLGLNFKITPNIPINDGIELVRGLFPKLWIDGNRCKYLIKCIENYHKRFNERLNVYSDRPEHDWSSHFNDSLRYLSVVMSKRQKGHMSESDADRLERQYSSRYL